MGPWQGQPYGQEEENEATQQWRVSLKEEGGYGCKGLKAVRLMVAACLLLSLAQ